MGRYHDTVKALTTCLSMEKSPECAYLEADAYNMLGMLFSFVGYEDIALDNYLSAIASAQKSRNLQGGRRFRPCAAFKRSGAGSDGGQRADDPAA